MSEKIEFNLSRLDNSLDYKFLGKEKFCKCFKISIKEFEKFLNNDDNVKFKTIFKLASALNVSIDSLIINSTQSYMIKFFWKQKTSVLLVFLNIKFKDDYIAILHNIIFPCWNNFAFFSAQVIVAKSG